MFDQYGKYLYTICFKSNNESFSLYYAGNNLRILIGGDGQIVVEFNDDGEVILAKKLNREYSSIHSDWVGYYTYNRKIQTDNGVFEKTSDNLACKVLGVNSMVTKSNEDSCEIVLNMTNREKGIFLIAKVSQLVLICVLISGFLFTVWFLGRNYYSNNQR